MEIIQIFLKSKNKKNCVILIIFFKNSEVKLINYLKFLLKKLTQQI